MALFDLKIKKGVTGRKETFEILKNSISATDKTLWFHCASLGEYEQGLPVFEKLKQHYKTHKIILSFFSPSGYEVRKNTPLADAVVYLPLDTKKNAIRFLNLAHPELTVFVKYDIWPNFLKEMQVRGKHAILISAAFRKHQTYFQWYGSPLRKALFVFEHIFTQNESSKILLESIGYNNVTISGDTRFDRVSKQLGMDNHLEFIDRFKGETLCIVGGSTWPEGEALIAKYINTHPSKDLKFIIAPHNIKPNLIQDFIDSIKEPVTLFSKKDTADLKNTRVFVIDTIGILSKIYSYADIAYVGGAVGTTGLHNTLEPAVFGVPIIIGSNYDKFPEAFDLIKAGGTFAISDQNSFDKILDELIENTSYRKKTGQANAQFIDKNKGAVIQICNFLRI
ncbi:glycosyltransferase N-terminal domain-containing protein [Gaetbulibacter aestuarii]